MRRLTIALLAVALLALPALVLAGSSDDGFDRVISAVEQRYQAHATRVPFMGLVGALSKAATGNGVGNMHVAEIAEMKGEVDGEELDRLVAASLGDDWTRMIRETHRGGDQTLIFVRDEGDKTGMFIVDVDGHELDVVELSVNPDRLSREIARHAHNREREDDDPKVK